MVAFAPNGDVYIAEGHANESPNDADSDDAANNVGAARIIHLDKNGKFINQWYGNEVGQGKFSSAGSRTISSAPWNPILDKAAKFASSGPRMASIVPSSVSGVATV